MCVFVCFLWFQLSVLCCLPCVCVCWLFSLWMKKRSAGGTDEGRNETQKKLGNDAEGGLKKGFYAGADGRADWGTSFHPIAYVLNLKRRGKVRVELRKVSDPFQVLLPRNDIFFGLVFRVLLCFLSSTPRTGPTSPTTTTTNTKLSPFLIFPHLSLPLFSCFSPFFAGLFLHMISKTSFDQRPLHRAQTRKNGSCLLSLFVACDSLITLLSLVPVACLDLLFPPRREPGKKHGGATCWWTGWKTGDVVLWDQMNGSCLMMVFCCCL